MQAPASSAFRQLQAPAAQAVVEGFAFRIDLMEKAELVERQRDPAQRNSVRVKLTPKGRRLKDSLLPIAEDVNRQAAKGLQATGLDALRASILTMVDNLNADTET